MVGAVGTGVLVFTGVLLLTWWVAGRPAGGRAAALPDPHLSREMIRRHGLQPAELAVVERAAVWGREVRDGRLRPAVVELAERQVRATGGRRTPSPWLVILFAAWGAALAGSLVADGSVGRWDDGIWFAVAPWLCWGWAGWRWTTGPERAVRLNGRSSAASPSIEGGSGGRPGHP